MSFESSLDTKEQIRRAIDIVEFIGQYVQLRREGRGYKGLCPWHDDSRPSLQVNPERQSFRCFVCNLGGDIFSFVMKMENVEFPEALAMLAERAGVKLSRGGGSGSVDAKRTMYQAMAWAEEQFHRCLTEGDQGQLARRYLESRSIAAESVRKYHLGFAPEAWDWLLNRARDTRFTPQVLESVGLAARRQNGPGYYDRFRGRVLFSIRDVQGRPVALGGRVLPELNSGEAAKYINSPETPLFSKSSLLYGLDQAKDSISKTRTALVMEGYTDCLVAWQCGFGNAVAVLGTALGERHIQLLRRYADRIVLVLDGDEAGRRRTDQILELFIAEQVDLRILTLPDQLDPADFLLQRGSEAFGALAAEAVDALEHKFRQATAALGAASGTHEANVALEDVLSTLAKAPRLDAGTSSAARLKEAQILHRLAHRFGVPEERLRWRLSDLRGGRRKAAAAGPVALDQSGKLDKAEQWLMEIVIQSPELLVEIRRQVSCLELRCPLRRVILAKCYELAEAGEVTFDRLMLEFDDPAVKSVLVELDEAGRAKNRLDAALELADLLETFRDERDNRQARLRQVQACPEPNEEEALDALRHIIERKRHRQGISAPTDG
ncbi:MAG: DNA primase [Pirellulales bacterium]